MMRYLRNKNYNAAACVRKLPFNCLHAFPVLGDDVEDIIAAFPELEFEEVIPSAHCIILCADWEAVDFYLTCEYGKDDDDFIREDISELNVRQYVPEEEQTVTECNVPIQVFIFGECKIEKII